MGLGFFLSTSEPVFLLVALCAAGLGAAVMGALARRPERLSQVELVRGNGAPPVSWPNRLQQRLDQAGFAVRVREFVTISAIGAVLGGLAFAWVMDSLVAGVFGLAAGGATYGVLLSQRAGRARARYEEELPQTVSRLLQAAQLRGGGGLASLAEHVAAFGPLSQREDWSFIAEQMKAGAPAEQVLRVVAARRDSYVVNNLFEILLLREEKNLPLTEILPPLEKSLEERVSMLRKARTRLSEPLHKILVVAVVPFLLSAVLRGSASIFASAFATLWGELISVACWSITVGACLYTWRTINAALDRESRVRFSLTVEKRAPLSSGTPGDGFGPGHGDSRVGSSAPEPIRGAVAVVGSEAWRAADDSRPDAARPHDAQPRPLSSLGD